MRVITGRFKGVPLTTPRSETRPTTDRTKEAMFSRLDSTGILSGARVLDLFGGTGALGIEALSRGANELVVVEASGPAAKLIAHTLTALRHNPAWEESMNARIVHAKAERYAAKAKVGEPFDVVLIDPPYAFSTADCERLLGDLTARGLVARDGMIVLERSCAPSDPKRPSDGRSPTRATTARPPCTPTARSESAVRARVGVSLRVCADARRRPPSRAT